MRFKFFNKTIFLSIICFFYISFSLFECESSFLDHNWPDDLIDIVNEPMDQTLSRMRRFSNSISNVERGGGGVIGSSIAAVAGFQIIINLI